MINLTAKAISNLSDGRGFTLKDSDVSSLVFEDATFSLTEAEITAEVTRLQAEYDNNEYQRQRAQAYPSIADQLDTIYHEGIDAWKAQIAAVKQEYPKP